MRYRLPDGSERSRTFERRSDADRFLTAAEGAIHRGDWTDPQRAAITVAEWVATWLPSREADLRATSYQRLSGVVRSHVVPKFGRRTLASVGNAEVRAWVAELQTSGLSAASTRKAVFALRSALDAAVADRRIAINAAASVPLPSEKAPEQRFLSRDDVDTLADAVEGVSPRRRVVVILGALCGLRWGEIAGLRRGRVDVLRSEITVCETAVQIDGKAVQFGEPKTKGSRRRIPVARSVMAEIDAHMAEFVRPESDALLVTGSHGGPQHRGTFHRHVWTPAVRAAGLEPLRPHDLRHTFVSLLVTAGANVKQVSTWAGHSSVTVTLDTYTHLFRDDGADVADRLDDLLTSGRSRPASVSRIGAG